MLASGPASRPSSIWIEMSQYIPTRATIREIVASPIGRAAQPGKSLTRRDGAGRARERPPLAAAMAQPRIARAA